MALFYNIPLIAVYFRCFRPIARQDHNEGSQLHEFTIAPPRKAGQDEDDLDKLSLLDANNLAGGQTRTIDFTFKTAAPAGTLDFECSYPGH